MALVCAAILVAPVGAAEVTLQPDTKGCNGVLPSSGGNTDMRLVGGTLTPGGTAVFEITYPLDSSDVGKQFTITACAFITSSMCFWCPKFMPGASAVDAFSTANSG